MLTKIKPENHDLSEQSLAGNNNHQDHSFEELLDDYAPEPLRKGQFVQGEILQIRDNVILADVDAKRTAIVPPQDLALIQEDHLEQLEVGDEVILYVMRTPRGDDDLLVSLNKGLEQQDWLTAGEYLENEELLELEVVGHNKGGLMVSFGHLRGFVPASHVPQLRFLHNPDRLTSEKAKLVGQELALKVIDVNPQRRRLVLSAKKAQKELRHERLLELKAIEGDTITGRIANLVKFGAFVELDGIEGLIHISEIAWHKVDSPADILKRGEEVEVMIQSVDIERERVSLSRRALLPSPWETFDEKHESGELVEGVVASVVDFGAFVLIEDGIEGLLHVSEMRGTKDFAPQDVLLPGDIVLVRIIDIQPEAQRLALSQKRVSQIEEMEWTFRREQPEAHLDDEEE
jgi:small subunit ribosomal protein S1